MGRGRASKATFLERVEGGGSIWGGWQQSREGFTDLVESLAWELVGLESFDRHGASTGCSLECDVEETFCIAAPLVSIVVAFWAWGSST